jgi:predicted DNA binding CopG/RHH family protein
MTGTEANEMKDEYDISKLNPRKNPYTNRLKRQVTININEEAIDYFKQMSEQCGLPYQTLINLYLMDCANNKRRLQINWN